MKKIVKIIAVVLLALLGVILAAGLCLGASVFAYSARDKKAFGQAQREHLAALEKAYSQPDYIPADEGSMTGFDIGANMDREWSYGSEPLSQQFDKGIRSIELDVMRERDGLLYMDELVADEFGARLYTPAEMLGEYENFTRLRAADGYPPLAELLDKIIVIYHYDHGTTEDYAAYDPSLRAQNMFISTLQWYDGNEDDWWPDSDVKQNYACFAIDNWSGSPILEENAREHNMLMRTRIDVYPWRDDEWEAEGMATGAFILTTDFPPRDVPGEDAHVAGFERGATVGMRPDGE